MVGSGSDLEQGQICLRFVIKNRDGKAFLDLPIHCTETEYGGQIIILMEEAKTQTLYNSGTSEAILELEEATSTAIDITLASEITLEGGKPTATSIDTIDKCEDTMEGESTAAASIDITDTCEETMEDENPEATSIDTTDTYEATMECEKPTATSRDTTVIAESNMEGDKPTTTSIGITVASEAPMDVKESTLKTNGKILISEASGMANNFPSEMTYLDDHHETMQNNLVTACEEGPGTKFQNPKTESLIGLVSIPIVAVVTIVGFVIGLVCKKNNATQQNDAEYGRNNKKNYNPEVENLVEIDSRKRRTP